MACRSTSIIILIQAMLFGQTDVQLGAELFQGDLVEESTIDALNELIENPRDINKITEEELWFLRPEIVAGIIKARTRGRFRSWNDVMNRTGLDPSSIAALQTMFYLVNANQPKGKISSRVTTAGEDQRIRSRFRLVDENLIIQGILQRDPDEYSLTDLSAISVGYAGKMLSAVAGSYRFYWGGGLVMGREFVPKPGFNAIGGGVRPVKTSPGYSNTSRGSLNGVGGSLGGGRAQLWWGYSRDVVDVSVIDSVLHIVNSRTHNSPGETAVEAIAYVGTIVRLLGVEIGALMAQQSIPGGTANDLLNQPISAMIRKTYNHRLGRLNLLIEGVRNGSSEAIFGRLSLRSSLSRRVRIELSATYRNYPTGWQPIRGKLDGRFVSQGNEEGLFLGGRLTFGWASLNGYLDQFRDTEDWKDVSRSGTLGLEGYKWGVGTTFAAHGYLLEMQFQEKHLDETRAKPTDEFRWVFVRNLHRYGRLRGMLPLTKTVRVTGFIAATLTSIDEFITEPELGRGLAYGGSWRYGRGDGTVVDVGMIVFQTDGWDERLYAYTAGLPGEFAVHSFSGVGRHGYLKLTYPVGRGKISVRYSRELKHDGDNDWRVIQAVGLQLEVAI